MSQDDDEWGTRLADVRVPSWYGVGAVLLAVAALVGSLRKRRAWDEATESLTEVATLLAQRMVEGDKRDDRMAELTERMEAYGRTSVRLAAASLAIAIVALVVAVAVAVA